MSRGAALHNISQSAASQHLSELEKKLGVMLLDRSSRPVGLTPAGKLYLDLCRTVIRQEEEFHKNLERIKNRVEGEVRVASIYSIGLSEMTRARELFASRYPGVGLRVLYEHPDRVYEAVTAGDADLGLVSYPQGNRHLAVAPWREEEMAVAASPWHPLAQTAILVPSDIEGHDFVAFDEGLRIRREIDRFFREQDVELRIAMHFDNIQTIKEAVALGSGISVLPARTMQNEIEQGRLVAVPLLAPELRRPLGILYRKRRRLSVAVRAFLDLLLALPEPAAPRPERLPVRR
ncbi:MAG: LysR family transcriptional regulator [Bryobacterales bacterium]|nr:LysR family transcriptional regulator [Bryobacterales bacterium]